MDIAFRTNGLRKLGSSREEMNRKLGARTANRLAQRLSELLAAESLEDMRNLPAARCHELKGKRRGQLAVDLDQPRRLIFEPAANPALGLREGGLDWAAVEEIVIVEIADYH